MLRTFADDLFTARNIVGDIFNERNLPTGRHVYIFLNADCESSRADGPIADAVYQRWPEANVISNPAVQPRMPGFLNIHTVYNTNVHIVHLFGKKRAGLPTDDDTSEQRLKWFTDALNVFRDARVGEEHDNGEHDAGLLIFPAGIGCDAGSGAWNKYKQAINSVCWIYGKVDMRILSSPAFP